MPKATTKKKRSYDPVKAHEYYMRTHKLKGRKKAGPRTSTKGMTDVQKEMVVYIKQQLKEELKAERERLAELRKARKDKLRAILKRNIAALRFRFGKVKKGSPDAAELKAEIAKMREEHKAKSGLMSDIYKSDYAKAKATNKEEIAQEIQKIREGKTK